MSEQGLTSSLFPPALPSDQPPQLSGGVTWKDNSSPHISAAPVGKMAVTDAVPSLPFPHPSIAFNTGKTGSVKDEILVMAELNQLMLPISVQLRFHSCFCCNPPRVENLLTKRYWPKCSLYTAHNVLHYVANTKADNEFLVLYTKRGIYKYIYIYNYNCLFININNEPRICDFWMCLRFVNMGSLATFSNLFIFVNHVFQASLNKN